MMAGQLSGTSLSGQKTLYISVQESKQNGKKTDGSQQNIFHYTNSHENLFDITLGLFLFIFWQVVCKEIFAP